MLLYNDNILIYLYILIPNNLYIKDYWHQI